MIDTKKLGWPGPRDMVRRLAAWWALRMVDLALGPEVQMQEPAQGSKPIQVTAPTGGAS